MLDAAENVLRQCRAIGEISDRPGGITRTFLSSATSSCYAFLGDWMKRLGMQVHIDAAGNLRGLYRGKKQSAPRVLIGSHLDTVPNAGLYDGVLGVVWALALVGLLQGERLPFALEVIGFSEEEGVRFGVPFIGSRAVAGTLDESLLQVRDRTGISVGEAIRDFGLDLSHLAEARLDASAVAYLELHIEQGPVLDSENSPLAAVTAIAGQSRALVVFQGSANHAGTTPMHLRRDALCGAAEWIESVEKQARQTEGLVATVGRIEARPGASNVIPGEVVTTLDVRHASDSIRGEAFEDLLEKAAAIARSRHLDFEKQLLLDQPAVPMHLELTRLIKEAIAQGALVKPREITSGAGHDAMILAPKLPSGMIFLRSPGGVSHHPSEAVLLEDVVLALQTGLHLLRNFPACPFPN